MTNNSLTVIYRLNYWPLFRKGSRYSSQRGMRPAQREWQKLCLLNRYNYDKRLLPNYILRLQIASNMMARRLTDNQ